MTASFKKYQVLVLNPDHTPLSFFPLSRLQWKEALTAVFKNRVKVLKEYDVSVNTPRRRIKLPSVVALLTPVEIGSYPAFSRHNVFLRDGYACQYCGIVYAADKLTFDHVIPVCRGGKTEWENIVTACAPCNARKGNKSLKDSGLFLKNLPKRPTNEDLQRRQLTLKPPKVHSSWEAYLS